MGRDYKKQWARQAFIDRLYDSSTRQYQTASSHYKQCFRQGLARTVPDFTLRPEQIYSLALESPTDFPDAIEFANKQHKKVLGSLATKFHAVESEHLGVLGNTHGQTICLTCNQSAYVGEFSNNALRDSCQEARRVVLSYRARKPVRKAKKRHRRRNRIFNQSFSFRQKNGVHGKLFWDTNKDLICLRPELIPRENSTIDVDFHNHHNLSQMIMLNKTELAVAVEYNPDWYHDSKDKENLESRIHDLNKYIAMTSFPHSDKPRAMYIIDPRATLRIGPDGSRPELGKPKYRGAGVDFYLAEGNNFPFHIHPSIEPLLTSLQQTYRATRIVHYRILVPVRTDI